MILNKSTQSHLLTACQFPEFQSDLPHFDCAKTKFVLDFKIGNFFERHIIQIETLVAQNDF
jgi:hypothetical protein